MILSKNIKIKKRAPKLVLFNEKKWERFGWFLTYKIDFESKILAIFDSSLLIQNSKFNNFLWLCWFLGKILSKFVSTVWKLQNLYCRNDKPSTYCNRTTAKVIVCCFWNLDDCTVPWFELDPRKWGVGANLRWCHHQFW